MRFCLAGLVFLLLVASSAGAQDRPTVEAYRLADTDAINLDGRIDEPFWQQAQLAGEFIQQAPVEGGTPSEPTELRIAYDAQNFYIGAIFYDSEPDGILGYQKARDAFLSTDDRFMWIIDTFQDGRTAYFFETNPAGLMADALLSNGGNSNSRSWDGIWEARVARGAYGWSAEIRIPFSTLNFDPDRDTWGINFQRTIRRKNEEMLWSGFRRDEGLRRPVHAGQVTGLRGMSQGIGLEVKPYSVGSWRNQPEDADPTEFNGDIGLDVQYSVTTNLRAALTINTDFAEVEADQRRVNLTRFPLFFPARRDFFLEGSSVFSFSPRNGVTPYFSRRIGLEGGQPIPIRYGTRLAGQAAGLDLAVLHVRTGETADVAAENFTVGRFKRNFGAQSAIGAVFTRRAPNSLDGAPAGPDQYTLGTDLDLFTLKFRGDKDLQLQAFFVWHNQTANDDDSAFWDRTTRGVRLTYPNIPWAMHVSYREFGDDFNPQVGFNRRNGFRRVQPSISYNPRLPQSAWIRELDFEIAFQHLMDLDFNKLTQTLDVTPLSIVFESGDRVGLEAGYSFERLDDAFNIIDDIIIDAGDYTVGSVTVDGRTASRRPVSVGGEVSYGGFWSGNRTVAELGLGLRPRPGISIEPSWEHNRVDLPGGNFTTNVFELESGWQFNPWIALTAIVQYDDVSELLSLFSRFRWIVEPGNDVFFIFTHNWQNAIAADLSPQRDRLVPLSRGAAFKVNYTRRF